MILMSLVSEFSDSVVCLSFHFIKKVGPIKGRQIINALSQRVGSIDDYVDAVLKALGTNSGFSSSDALKAFESAHSEIEKVEEFNIRVIPITSEEYPKNLSRIPDAPAALFLLGSADALNRDRQVAVVGTRKPSRKGALSCQRITQTLVEGGASIVSGLALGCDTIAHETCLDSKGVTIAVMPCGLDSIAPASNRALADAIVNSGGALVSEYPLGTKPNRANYVQRNRIQSGLSCAVIIVEAAAKSGTMETARHCERQGRNLYAITPDTFDANTDVSGNRELIESGVNALGTKDDIQDLIQKLDDVAGNDRLL
jgi:DNA processing protein